MKRVRYWTILPVLVLLYACSGPPDFRPPDRPPSLDGVIVSIEVSAESIDIVDLGVQATGDGQPVRSVTVDHETLVLTPGNPYPLTVVNLQRGRFVRVWLRATTEPSSAARPTAEYVEIEAATGQ